MHDLHFMSLHFKDEIVGELVRWCEAVPWTGGEGGGFGAALKC